MKTRGFALALAALVVVLGSAVSATAHRGPDGFGPGPPPTTGRWTSNWFHSPTGNIRCRYYPRGGYVACKTLNNQRLAGVTLFGRSYRRADGYNFSFPAGPTLGYGQNWIVRGRFRCDSRFKGMTCRSLVTGRGFFINRSGSRIF